MTCSNSKLFNEIHDNDSQKLTGGKVLNAWYTGSGGGGGQFTLGINIGKFTFVKNATYMYQVGNPPC